MPGQAQDYNVNDLCGRLLASLFVLDRAVLSCFSLLFSVPDFRPEGETWRAKNTSASLPQANEHSSEMTA
jgi:hypothetical protein